MSVSDADLAAAIAETTGQLLQHIAGSGLFEGKALGAAGDCTANAFILSALAHHRPEDAVLSEEEKDSPERLTKSRVWIVDPLDGTREYSEGRSDWAVHIALAIDGTASIGAVALPGLNLVLRSDQPLPLVREASPLRMVVSRTRPAAEALAVATELNAELMPMGSAGAKAMAVVRGEADVYLHSGGQYEWDSCAPIAVAMAAGLHVSRINGAPMIYNRQDTYLPDLLICHKSRAAEILEIVGNNSA